MYSSTEIKKNFKPNIVKEKLISIMDSENVTFDDIYNVLNDFKKKKVHVVGDTIVDKYNYCTILGQTTKTPTFSVKKVSDQVFLGGAAIVAKHLSKLGAKVTFTTLIGEDKIGSFVKKDLKNQKLKSIILLIKAETLL